MGETIGRICLLSYMPVVGRRQVRFPIVLSVFSLLRRRVVFLARPTLSGTTADRLPSLHSEVCTKYVVCSACRIILPTT